ncbi:MAG TPA: lysophospholipid acyltransferase family protein [Paludibacter sp.]
MKAFSKFIFKLAGWKAIVTIPEPPKSVICIAPHTSNWDFPIGELYYWALGRHSFFLMKKSWFFFPMGNLLRSLGGIAVDRSKRTSVTDQMTDEFNERETFHLAITPEGTRGMVKKWKMGFYHIAVKAHVPIQLAYIDYAKKEMGITSIFYPTGDEVADLAKIQDFYKDVVACHPEKFYIPGKRVNK